MRICGFRLLLALALLLPGSSCARREPARPLTVLLLGDIVSLDPNQETESITDSVLFNVYEPLVALDEDLKFRMVLAESYEHPSPERWRFRLRRGVRFHDGTPLTAATVREALLSVGQVPERESAMMLRQVREIVAVSEDTLDVVTHEPRAILASLPLLYVAKRDPQGGLSGTGPYRLASWSKGERVVLQRFDGYWGGRPEFGEVHFVPVYKAEERLARLQKREADIAYGLTPEQAAGTTPGVHFVRRTGLTVFYLSLNLRKGHPFADARVRRALHLGLDREALVSVGLRGTGAVATQPIAPLVFGFNPRIKIPVRDLVEARRLLKEAGHPRGFHTVLEFGLGRQRFAELVRDQLMEIGVTVALRPLPLEGMYERSAREKGEMLLVGWDCSSGVSSEFFEFCLHSHGQAYGLGNFGGYSNPVIDDIAERNAAILDQRARQTALQQAAAIAMDDLPVLPLFVEDDIYGHRAGITFRPRADSEVRLLDVRSAPR